MDPQLKNYIEAQRKAGTPEADIKNTLLETGWDEATVNTALETKPSSDDGKIPTEPAKMASPRLTPKMSSSKGFRPIILLIVVAALIGGGVWAYFKYFPQMTPQEVLAESMSKTNNLESYNFDAEVNTDFSMPEETLTMVKAFAPISSGKFQLGFSGTAGQTDNNIEADVTFSLSNDGNKILEAQERIKDYKIYYKLNALEIPMLALFVDVNTLKKNWIELSSDGLLPADEADEMPSNEELLKTYMEKAKEIEKEIDYNKLYTIKHVFDDEMINDVKTYHYQLMLNKDEAISIIDKVINQFLSEFESEFPSDADMSPEEDIQELKDLLAGVNFPPIDVWIGKDDLHIHQIYTMLKISDLGLEDIGALDQNDTISFKMNLRDFNAANPISAPENVITVNELLEELSNGAFGAELPFGLGEPTDELDELNIDSDIPNDLLDDSLIFDDSGENISVDELVDTDNDGLFDFEELQYKTDINNPDTDGDGFTDGQEVTGGYNPNGPGRLQ